MGGEKETHGTWGAVLMTYSTYKLYNPAQSDSCPSLCWIFGKYMCIINQFYVIGYIIYRYDGGGGCGDVASSKFCLIVTLVRVIRVESAQTWFPVSFFWGRPGAVQLAQGDTV